MISFSFGLHISSYFVKIHIEMSKIYKFLSTFIIFFLPLQQQSKESFSCTGSRSSRRLILVLIDDWRRSQ